MAQIEKMIAKTFMDIATGLETGSFGARPKIAVTGLGSEHGEANSVEAAVLAADRGVDVTLIGTAENEKFTTVKVSDEDEMYKEMEKMLDKIASNEDIKNKKEKTKIWRKRYGKKKMV